jgi:mRNA interferase MazF
VSARPLLTRGDAVLISFPFTDLSGQKLSPALTLGQSFEGDLIVAFVTTQTGTRSTAALASEHVLQPVDPEFAVTGLRAPSSIRLDKIATLHRRLAQRRLGHIGPTTSAGVANCLRYVLGL